MKHWRETQQVLDHLAALHGAGHRAALATVVRVRGSAYRREGAKLLVGADGTSTGNVSGGCLEQDVREVAREVLGTGIPRLQSYCSGTDEIAAWDLGLGCEGQVDVFVEPALAPRSRERVRFDGREPFAVCTMLAESALGAEKRLIVLAGGVEGEVDPPSASTAVAARARALLAEERSALAELDGRSVFVDVFLPPPELAVFGAGDDAPALVRCALEVGFRVLVVDRRPALLAPDRFPPGVRLLESDADHLAERLALDESSYAVVMTHHFADDRAYVRALLATPVRYIGMLGPRRRTDRILRDLGGEQAPAPARVYAPVGLDLGTDGAEQVALAVVAELLAVRSGRRTRSLRERRTPIHAAAAI
jgi:xanthine/CO dehydrogenase XdhC/CoxF family maturation factor